MIIRIGPILVLSFLFAACEQESTTSWDMSLPWSIQEFHTTNAIRFAEEVYEATDGALYIRVFPGAVLGLKGPESLRALEEGIVDMAEMPAFQQVGSEPLLGIESLPYLVRNQDDLRLLFQVLRPKIEAIYASHGSKILYMVPWPNQNIYTRKPFETLAELAGVKIRTYDRNTSELMRRLGLVPIQMPSSDVVPALASGVVDAVMTSTTTGAAQRYWEFLDVINRTNHVWITNIMAVNLGSWNDLPEDVQMAIEEVAARLEPEFWEVSRRDDAAKLAILLENGMSERHPSDDLLNEMRQAARPMWDEFVLRVGPEAVELLDAYLNALEDTQ